MPKATPQDLTKLSDIAANNYSIDKQLLKNGILKSDILAMLHRHVDVLIHLRSDTSIDTYLGNTEYPLAFHYQAMFKTANSVFVTALSDMDLCQTQTFKYLYIESYLSLPILEKIFNIELTKRKITEFELLAAVTELDQQEINLSLFNS
ncbi:hypothetical protein [Vibrio diabolicus]|jgi:hypothetical protein|uniref:hypothetical protein n=1 Tax=Vibrio diabolicus TaxID=50719 RepID=UPI000470F027|nr:hypothetical protein [Vibrio diabolicus]UDY85749.1 hypothetical protein LJY22_23580 [Vibrio diabolicus]